ncbi:MAG: hypothetical protein KKF44_05805 [Nanoarchaeota archaeon]|nr:hypothetical protein [Nanoarchaeota archaeon]
MKLHPIFALVFVLVFLISCSSDAPAEPAPVSTEPAIPVEPTPSYLPTECIGKKIALAIIPEEKDDTLYNKELDQGIDDVFNANFKDNMPSFCLKIEENPEITLIPNVIMNFYLTTGRKIDALIIVSHGGSSLITYPQTSETNIEANEVASFSYLEDYFTDNAVIMIYGCSGGMPTSDGQKNIVEAFAYALDRKVMGPKQSFSTQVLFYPDEWMNEFTENTGDENSLSYLFDNFVLYKHIALPQGIRTYIAVKSQTQIQAIKDLYPETYEQKIVYASREEMFQVVEGRGGVSQEFLQQYVTNENKETNIVVT